VALALTTGIGILTFVIGALAAMASALAWTLGRPRPVTIRFRVVAFFAALFWFWYIVPIVARIP
jgi:hypothetical protein